MPVGAAMLLVSDFMTLLSKYPGLAVELVVSEQIEDLVAERLDLALRFGQSADTSLVARALGTMGSTAVAAPAYLERYGAPEHPSDLLNHTCIIQDTGPDSTHWAFSGPDGSGGGGGQRRVSVKQQHGRTAGGVVGIRHCAARRSDDTDGNPGRPVVPVAAELYRAAPSRRMWSIRRAGIWRNGRASSSTS